MSFKFKSLVLFIKILFVMLFKVSMLCMKIFQNTIRAAERRPQQNVGTF